MRSFVSWLLHGVFTTNHRERWVTPAIRGTPLALPRRHCHRGVNDHVHLLVSPPSTLTILKAMQLLKGNSPKWIHGAS